jgi:hypothetical protein
VNSETASGQRSPPPAAPATLLDLDASGRLKDWCLRESGGPAIPNADNGTATLPRAVAITAPGGLWRRESQPIYRNGIISTCRKIDSSAALVLFTREFTVLLERKSWETGPTLARPVMTREDMPDRDQSIYRRVRRMQASQLCEGRCLVGAPPTAPRTPLR